MTKESTTQSYHSSVAVFSDRRGRNKWRSFWVDKYIETLQRHGVRSSRWANPAGATHREPLNESLQNSRECDRFRRTIYEPVHWF